jgi:uncharacterized membrane protein YfhO
MDAFYSYVAFNPLVFGVREWRREELHQFRNGLEFAIFARMVFYSSSVSFHKVMLVHNTSDQRR